MNQPAEKPKPDDVVRTMRIITGALMLGVVMFALVAVNLNGVSLDLPKEFGVLTLGGLAAGASALVVQRVVLQMLRAQSIKWIAQTEPPDVDILPGAWQTRTIVALALLEGAAFLNVVAFMQEKNAIGLVVAVVLLCAMAGYFPTPAGVRETIAEDERRVEDERQMK